MIMRDFLPPTCSILARLLTSQLTQVSGRMVNLILGAEEALLKTKLETDASLALPGLANLGALIALRLVVLLVGGGGTLGSGAVTEGGLGAVLLRLAHHSVAGADKVTLVITTWSNAGAALLPWLQLAAPVVELVVAIKCPGIATLLCTLDLVKATVTLLPLLHNLVATECSVVLLETIMLSLIHHSIQDSADILD